MPARRRPASPTAIGRVGGSVPTPASATVHVRPATSMTPSTRSPSPPAPITAASPSRTVRRVPAGRVCSAALLSAVSAVSPLTKPRRASRRCGHGVERGARGVDRRDHGDPPSAVRLGDRGGHAGQRRVARDEHRRPLLRRAEGRRRRALARGLALEEGGTEPPPSPLGVQARYSRDGWRASEDETKRSKPPAVTRSEDSKNARRSSMLAAEVARSPASARIAGLATWARRASASSRSWRTAATVATTVAASIAATARTPSHVIGRWLTDLRVRGAISRGSPRSLTRRAPPILHSMLILFDIDGTLLLGTPIAHTEALARAAADVFAVEATAADVVAISPGGRTDQEIARLILRRHGVDDARDHRRARRLEGPCGGPLPPDPGSNTPLRGPRRGPPRPSRAWRPTARRSRS